jgi:hypothetical protein
MMQKILEFIKEESEKAYDDTGALTTSLEKKYFNYTCHEADTPCQITPVVCRIVDRFHPLNEPQWQTDESGCAQCFEINNRVLEDLYLQSA